MVVEAGKALPTSHALHAAGCYPTERRIPAFVARWTRIPACHA